MGDTGRVASDNAGVRTRLWQQGELKSEHFPLDELSEHLQTDGSLVWVDLCEPNHQHLQELAAELDLDQHAVEDAVTRDERPKATRHASHTFITAYATRLEKDPEPSPDPLHSRLELTRISAFVLPQGIITVRFDDRFDIDAVVQRWDDNADLIRHGVGTLVHGLLDVIVDSHFETVEELDELIESLEDGLFDESALTRTVQRNTYRVRKELVELRRVCCPCARSSTRCSGTAPRPATTTARSTAGTPTCTTTSCGSPSGPSPCATW